MSELAEGARLEIVCAAKSGTEGSNPSLSATDCLLSIEGILSILYKKMERSDSLILAHFSHL